MDFLVYSRALVPSHFYRAKVLAWQCSVCRKLFLRPLKELDLPGGEDPPPYIECEFRVHSCELVWVERQERREAKSHVLFPADERRKLRFDR